MRGVLAIALWALCGAGCVRERAPVRLPQAEVVAVAHVVDGVYDQTSAPLPGPLAEAIAETLVVRNIQPRLIDPARYLDRFAALRHSGRRLEVLQDAAAGARALLLVETQARFYSQLSGRYRWTVYARLTIREPSGAQLDDDFEVPVLLLFDHEREADALVEARDEIARRVGRLLDTFFSGAGASSSAARGAAPGGPAPGSGSPGTPMESIYFVLVDRFANGDPSNDGEVDRTDPQAWHGGDLRGVIEHLDHIRELGFQSVWISPVFGTRHAPVDGIGAFHGYWIDDLTSVDPRFGTEADLENLAAALHERGMGLVLDWVVNHVGYDTHLVREKPEWFHPNGPITDWNDPRQLVDYQVHGLPDLAQERDDVYAYVLGAAQGWLERGVAAGLRLDAVKHVPMSFWRRYNADLRARAPSLVSLGELFDGSPAKVAAMLQEGSFTHAFDFPVAFALRDVFCAGRSPGALGAVLYGDRFYDDPGRMVTFVDNHDLPRIRSACGDDPDRVRAALSAQLALRGVPALTYGTEAGLRGKEEPDNRGDMVFEPAAADDLRAHIRRAMQLRREHPALRAGLTRVVEFRDDILVLGRADPGSGDAVLVVVAGSKGGPVPLPVGWKDGATFVDLATGEDVAEPAVAPGAVRLFGVQGDAAVRALVAGEDARRSIQFEVDGVTLADGESLALVGSGPELGEWSPQAAPGLDAPIALPVGGLFACKLVVRGPGAAARWEGGENRHLFVRPGGGPTLTLTWQEG